MCLCTFTSLWVLYCNAASALSALRPIFHMQPLHCMLCNYRHTHTHTHLCICSFVSRSLALSLIHILPPAWISLLYFYIPSSHSLWVQLMIWVYVETRVPEISLYNLFMNGSQKPFVILCCEHFKILQNSKMLCMKSVGRNGLTEDVVWGAGYDVK